MTSGKQLSTVPELMTRACARFFAADWEASSFLEFFVDLQLRVSDDPTGSVGRTLTRLADHGRFALQLTLVRSVDSFVAYLAETAEVVTTVRRPSLWQGLMGGPDAETSAGLYERGVLGASSVPVDVSLRYVTTLTHGNVRQLGRLFEEATDVQLFDSQNDLELVGRLVSLRNLIANGRIFAAQDLAVLVDETASVAGLGLRLKDFREDLKLLRAWVAEADESVAKAWGVERPITDKRLFEAISSASGGSPGGAKDLKAADQIEV